MNRYDLVKDLKRADILVTCNNTILGKLIEKFTKSIYSHAAIYIGGGGIVDATNKFGKGVRVRTLKQTAQRFYRIDVLRYPNLSDDKAEKICSEVLNHVGESYNYIMLFLFPLMAILPDKWRNPFVEKEAKICSELVSRTYKKVGIDLIPNKTEGQESPADIGRSKVLRFIGAYLGMRRTKLKRGRHPE